MKKLLLAFVIAILTAMGAAAQVFSTSPAPLQQESKDVTITFHADRCDVAALKGLPSGTSLYAHIGVYTNLSPNSWAHVISEWGVNSPATEMKQTAANTYTLSIGDIRTYFGITDPSETVTKICILVRNSTANAQTKDYFIDVVESGFQATLTSDASSLVITEPTTMTFTMNTTQKADIEISVNGTGIAKSTGATTASGEYHFATAGESWIITGRAKAGSEVIEKTLEVSYPLASPAATYPGGIPKMGAVKNNDGSVTFCLAAPGKSSAMIVGSWDEYRMLNDRVMAYQDYNGQRYFWITIDGLDNSTPYPYYYLIDGNIKVADPYAHLVLDCYSDKWLRADVFPGRPNYPYDVTDDTMMAVYQGNIDDYDWNVDNFDIPEHHNLIIYEMLFRDFTGTDKTDDGTVRAAIDKIPYLKSLGVNAVELMPIMEFNGNNSWGYNTNFYMAPDKAYGSPDDYKEFIDRCHMEGIAVILDIVFNQSDGLHPWYQMYPASANPFYNATAPHAYSVLNDWKQENPLVRRQWIDAITYWMTAYKVDGFRFDLVKGLGDSNSYGGDTEKYNQSRVDNMKALHAAIKAVNPKGIHINENLAGPDEENAMATDGQLNWANKNTISANFATAVGSKDNLASYLSTADAGRVWGSTVAYAESHDEQRIGYLQSLSSQGSGSSSLKRSLATRCKRQGSMAAQLIMTPGPKMIWQFAELCADENTKNPDNSNITDAKNVCWNYLDIPERKALYDNYSELIWLRRDNPELFTADATFNTLNFQDGITYGRSIQITDGKKEILVFINPGVANTATMTVTANASIINASNNVLASHNATGTTPVLTSGSGSQVNVTLPPNCYAVFVSKNVESGIDSVVDDTVKKVNILGGQGRIIIEGEYNTLTITDLSGRTYNTLTVLPGLYIVKADDVVAKVIVR